MIIVWLFGIAYAIVTFLAPFYIISLNKHVKALEEICTRMDIRK